MYSDYTLLSLLGDGFLFLLIRKISHIVPLEDWHWASKLVDRELFDSHKLNGSHGIKESGALRCSYGDICIATFLYQYILFPK